MSGYLDKDFKPVQEFWNAMWVTNVCPHCNYHANVYTMKADLLKAPVDCVCRKCKSKWSVAIPLGECEQRTEIEKLLALEQEFYRRRDELADIIDTLDGRKE